MSVPASTGANAAVDPAGLAELTYELPVQVRAMISGAPGRVVARDARASTSRSLLGARLEVPAMKAIDRRAANSLAAAFRRPARQRKKRRQTRRTCLRIQETSHGRRGAASRRPTSRARVARSTDQAVD